jgi:DNA-binding transcriptional regulator YiaG
MAKLDDVLKAMILYHGRRIARELLGELPAQVKQAQRDIRTIHKTLAKLTRQVERLVEQQEPEAPVLAASEDQLKGARLTKRTLPALRKRFSLTQHELAKLLQVGVMTTGIWERGQSQPRRRNVARINALRSMTQEQVDAALGRRPALPAMTPQQIKSLRQKLGLSRQELGEHLGVAASAVKTWEQGKSDPAARHREGLAPIKAMSQEQVNAALRRQPAVPAMSPREIKGLRQKLGLAQGELAKLLGVWAVTVGTWERGRSVPGAANRAALAEI